MSCNTHDSKPTCLICIQPITNTLFKTQCGHVYHNACITQWLLSESSCPTCRNNIYKKKNTRQTHYTLYKLDADNQKEHLVDIQTRNSLLNIAFDFISYHRFKEPSIEIQVSSKTKYIKQIHYYNIIKLNDYDYLIVYLDSEYIYINTHINKSIYNQFRCKWLSTYNPDNHIKTQITV